MRYVVFRLSSLIILVSLENYNIVISGMTEADVVR